MDIGDCYRILGLSAQASLTEVKASYRRLARQYHPDINPGDAAAHDQFIILNQAYQLLMSVIKTVPDAPKPEPKKSTSGSVSPKIKVTQPHAPNSSPSDIEQQLKRSSYQQLQQLLRGHRFPLAIALVEGLAQRLPQDPEVRQWQAIAYQRWGRDLVDQHQLDKARIYLKKALRTDPHNRALWLEVERDFRRLEQIF